jgi:hypothetical protein
MFKLNKHGIDRSASRAHWAWLLPILALSPLAMAAKGCNNSGVVGDDCPTAADCMNGTAGKTSGSGGSGMGSGEGKTCGGLLGVTCADDLFCNFPSSALCGAADQTGTCAAKPEVCTDIYAPVCGCDGKTYSSDCEAQAAGMSVASKGECASGGGGTGSGGSSGTGGSPGTGKTCGGLQGLQCGANEYCAFPAGAMCGAADQTGSCAVKPQVCTTLYAPVCGCDGKTYGNDCGAAAAGVSVSTKGECAGGGVSCGTRGAPAMCAANQYCYYAPGQDCGRSDAAGKCTDIPKGAACDAIFAPVCGCDGKTYGNDCEANVAGVSVDHTGACAGTGGTCGGLLGKTCSSGYFCDFPADMACGNADGTGTCTQVPTACTDEVAPVCGCDGKTYVTACTANSKGISVASKGACK